MIASQSISANAEQTSCVNTLLSIETTLSLHPNLPNTDHISAWPHEAAVNLFHLCVTPLPSPPPPPPFPRGNQNPISTSIPLSLF